MKELQIFNFENQNVRTVEQYGEPWFVLTDVCKILEITNTRNTAKRLDADEKGVRLVDTPGGKQKITIINESGLYSVVLRSDKPQAKPFRKWVTSEVLPSIRKNGAYAAKTQVSPQMPAIRLRSLEVREMNARSRQAKILVRLADMTLNSTYRETLIANAANLAMGQQLLPLPQLKSRTYSAAEIGEKLGISANKVGRLANAHGLKTPEYGDWFADKAKSADKEVQTFRYYPDVVPKLGAIIKGDVYYEQG